ncbi:MAG: hypothetical protein LBV69_09465 [Bacteroidales bacterium]|nr:hypothetical protein [Bacteroidales bacterium]
MKKFTLFLKFIAIIAITSIFNNASGQNYHSRYNNSIPTDLMSMVTVSNPNYVSSYMNFMVGTDGLNRLYVNIKL